MVSETTNGISGTYNGDNIHIYQALTAFSAIAWYNAAELIVLVLVIFKKYTGTYFWSLLITSISIFPYSLGAWMKLVVPSGVELVSVAFLSIGWMVMVPGQSMVLYSRLHLITQNQRILRFVFWMIIIDAMVLCIPTSVLTFGSNSDQAHLFLRGFSIMEKIQMSCFVIQELIISCIYLWEIRRILSVVYEGGTRQLMYELIAINVVIIILDIALITVEFLNFYEIETVFKGMVYSVKLKLEFGVLSKLVKVVTATSGPQRVASVAQEMDFKDSGSLQTFASPLFSPTRDRRPSARTMKSTRSGSVMSGPHHLEHASSFYTTSDSARDPSITSPALTLSHSDTRLVRRDSLSDSYPGKLV